MHGALGAVCENTTTTNSPTTQAYLEAALYSVSGTHIPDIPRTGETRTPSFHVLECLELRTINGLGTEADAMW